jgi:hypothetical protein
MTGRQGNEHSDGSQGCFEGIEAQRGYESWAGQSDGYSQSNPAVHTSGHGAVCWKACYRPSDEEYFIKTGFINPDYPLMYLFRNGEVTETGQKFLASN